MLSKGSDGDSSESHEKEQSKDLVGFSDPVRHKVAG